MSAVVAPRTSGVSERVVRESVGTWERKTRVGGRGGGYGGGVPLSNGVERRQTAADASVGTTIARLRHPNGAHHARRSG